MLVYFKDGDRSCRVTAIGEMYRHSYTTGYLPSMRYNVVQMVPEERPDLPPMVMSLFEFLKTAKRKDNKPFRLCEGPACYWGEDVDAIEVTFQGFAKTAGTYNSFIIGMFNNQQDELSLDDLNDFHLIIE